MSQNSIKHNLDESLSALVDGEITELEMRRLLKLDNEQYKILREKWVHYQVASSSIKGEFPDIAFRDLSTGIGAAIDDEPAHSVKTQTGKTSRIKSMWSGVGRFAVAASVAGAVVLGVQFTSDDFNSQVADVKPAPSTSVKIPGSFGHGLPSDTTVSTVSNQPTPNKSVPDAIILNKDTQQQLQKAEQDVNRLMLEHAQNAAQNTQQGVLPYARVPESSKSQ